MDAFAQKLAAREPMVGAAVGSGAAACAAVAGGADFILVLAASHFRMHGTPSVAALLPYANANQLAWDLAAKHVLPRAGNTPVFVGVCAQDPSQSTDELISKAIALGVAGVTNFPSVSFFDERQRDVLSSAGYGFDRELALLSRARKAGLMTVGIGMRPAECAALAAIDVSIMCMNLGITEWRPQDPVSHQAALDLAVTDIHNMLEATSGSGKAPYTVVFGGPVVMPQDTAQIYQRTQAQGYIGGSSVERFPASAAITQATRDLKYAAAPTHKTQRLGSMIGASQAMADVFDTIKSVAESNAPVLIVGESGTGKELAARELHRLSGRSNQPLVTWNCGATSESLAMSELFGHEKGAFTGAVRTHSGKFEQANNGTLFMDEVADLPASVQASLLRVIQEQEMMRVGSEKTIALNVRLVAASNKPFDQLIPSGQFRLDLYFRLSTVVLRMPALRQRVDDIPFLVWELSQEFSQKYAVPVVRFSDEVMRTLMKHSWPGNIRELRNTIERVYLLGKGRALSSAWFESMFCTWGVLLGGSQSSATANVSLEEKWKAKRQQLESVLARHMGNKTAAASELGVTRKTIHKWLSQQNEKHTPPIIG